MDTVNFHGTPREVEITPYLQVGTTVLGVMRIDGILYTVEKRQDETVWSIVRRWTTMGKEQV
jgi:hypothetical protein